MYFYYYSRLLLTIICLLFTGDSNIMINILINSDLFAYSCPRYDKTKSPQGVAYVYIVNLARKVIKLV